MSTTSSQLDETEQPSVGTTDLEDRDVSPKEVGCLANSSPAFLSYIIKGFDFLSRQKCGFVIGHLIWLHDGYHLLTLYDFREKKEDINTFLQNKGGTTFEHDC